MDSDDLLPILAGIARHVLTTAGGMLVTSGYMQSSELSGFVGGGLVVLGIAWSWWQKRGAAQVSDLLQKLTKTKTTATAVAVAKVTPPKQ